VVEKKGTETGEKSESGPVVERGRRCLSEAGNDRAMLWWIGRFRFVTSAELSVRFGVCEQRVNARVRRLLEAGLVGGMRPHKNARRLVFLTQRGSLQLGLGERRPPRTDVQLRHELAIAMLVARQEAQRPGETDLLTERECRRAERESHQRWSADVQHQGRRQRRWPDLVQVDGMRRRAIELELSIKHTRRLQAIVDGYRISPFEEVLWLVEDPNLERRLTTMAERTSWGTPLRVVRVEPDSWHTV